MQDKPTNWRDHAVQVENDLLDLSADYDALRAKHVEVEEQRDELLALMQQCIDTIKRLNDDIDAIYCQVRQMQSASQVRLN